MEDLGLKDRLSAAKSYHETAHSASVSTNYPLTEVLWAGATKFVGELVIASNEEHGLMLFTDGELQSSESDERIYHEFAVHPTILLHRHLFGDVGKPLKVLVLGGGEGATVRELVKYSSEEISEVIWNDIDKDLCDLCDKFIGYSAGYMQEEVAPYDSDSKKRVKIMYEDANALLKEERHQGVYDIVINDLPDPGENDEGLYSPEFFADLYKCCADKSVIVSHAGPVSPTHMQVKNFLKDNLCKAGFEEQIKFGLVAIPSFQSEWGYVYSYKTPTPTDTAIEEMNYAAVLDKHGPPTDSLHIVDQHSLRRFFDIPPYYFK